MIAHERVGVRGALLDLSGSASATPAATAVAVRRLALQLSIALVEVIPGACTVLVLADQPRGLQLLMDALDGLIVSPEALEDTGEPIELAVRYNGPDLKEVAARTGLSVDEVVRRHSKANYISAFTGFAPGFAYLTGLDPCLHLPRRDTPRPAVPAGSLAIADTYTAVYPRSSPGGWHLLGTVSAEMFDLARSPAALLSPGQKVRFVAAPG